jgi:hypothetical protein
VAEEVVDPDRRLPGEEASEASDLVEDAVHWQLVYSELLSFKRTLLNTAAIHTEDAPEAVVAEVSADQRLLETELRRLERRHDFWEQRVRVLQDAGQD